MIARVRPNDLRQPLASRQGLHAGVALPSWLLGRAGWRDDPARKDFYDITRRSNL